MKSISLMLALYAFQEKDFAVQKLLVDTATRVTDAGVEFAWSASALETLWERQTGNKEEAPSVDFAKCFVVVVLPEGRWNGIAASAATDGKKITLSLVLGEGAEPKDERRPRFSFVVLARSDLPLSIRTRVSECGAINAKRDRTVGTYQTTCASDCHEAHLRDEVNCWDCAGGTRRSCDATCGACARARGTCAFCGRLRKKE